MQLPNKLKNLPEDTLPFSLALKAESKIMGKECKQIRISSRKSIKQYV